MSILTDPKNAAPGQGTPPGNGTPPDNQDWRVNLPEDLRSEKVFESIKGKDWSEAGPLLAKNYVHAQRMVGADKLVVPDDKATPEQIADFYKRLGRPEAADKYTYKLPEGVKEDMIKKETLDTWRKELFEAGLTTKQADRIMSKYLQEEYSTQQANKAAAKKQEKEWLDQLHAEFGPKLDENVNFAGFALKRFGDKEGKLVRMLDETGLGNHPDVVRFFAQVGRSVSDDSARGGGGARFNTAPQSAAEAQAALNSFNRDESKQKALWDPKHASHDAVVKEREDLFKLAFADPKKE